MSDGGLRLNLGCGGKRLPGFVNIDKMGSPDLRLDLEKAKLPFKTGSVREVHLTHVLEHVENFLPLLAEVHRVCENGALIRLTYPIGNVSFADPTHRHYWNAQTVDYFCNGEYLGIPKFSLESKRLNSDRRISFLPRFIRKLIHFFTNRGFFEVDANLRVVKGGK